MQSSGNNTGLVAADAADVSGGAAGPVRNPTPSWWLEQMPAAPSAAELPEEADVVIVGAGMTGAATAYWLSRSGRSSLVLDARGIAGGATGRNGGHLWCARPHIASCLCC